MQARRAALLKLNESYDGLGDAMATDPTEIPVDFLRAQKLMVQKIPEQLEVGEVPRNPAGKVMKQDLRKRYGGAS